MIHTMDLAPIPFAMIESGKKTIELRLYDEKRQKMKVGDKIEFVNTKNGKKLKAKILGLNIFPSFEKLYANLPLLDCGYTEETLEAASYRDMEIYYSPERQKMYGVVGIKIELC